MWCVTCVRRAHCEAAAGRHDLRPISRRVGSLVVLGSHSLDTPQYVSQHLPESSSDDELNRSALELKQRLEIRLWGGFHWKPHPHDYVYTLAASCSAVRIPHGVRTDQLGCYPFLLEQQLRAQASLANLLFCVGIWVGSPRTTPWKLICIHSLSTCTFPVQVMIYLKHYLYSCSAFEGLKW